MSTREPLPLAVASAIDAARVTKRLSLSKLLSAKIPDEVFELQDLEYMDVSHCVLERVPAKIGGLKHLRRVDLRGNFLETVPDVPGLVLDWTTYLACSGQVSPPNIAGMGVRLGIEGVEPSQVRDIGMLGPVLASLPNLDELSIGTIYARAGYPVRPPVSSLQGFIDRLGDLERLESLSIGGVLLGAIPAGIRRMQRLKYLSLWSVGISQVPGWISDLTGLRMLLLNMNEIQDLPGSIADLRQLVSLDLFGNRLRAIPAAVFRMPWLTELNIGSSGRDRSFINRIPATILDLPNLHVLRFDKQPIVWPPPEIASRGLDAIRDYWRQQQNSGVDYLAEAKLIIVGEPGAGKTSLAKKLCDPNYQLEEAEPTTKGVDVHPWAFKAGIAIRDDGGERVVLRDFRVNTWDFGGQEIYHATHQFFLTRRSLYILLADDRKEDTDFNYWLDAVNLLSDGSPVLIVHNEKQDRRREVDLPALRARFPNLREAYRVNLADNRGLDELTRAIRRDLGALPHIGAPLPATWKRVRDALEKDARTHISQQEFLEICQRHGFDRHQDKLQLSGYLHDLGIILHFQNDAVLKNTVILKPSWGTDAVYRVLDDSAVLASRGRFDESSLAKIWSEDAYAGMQQELLRLMINFRLCYQLPGEQQYIAPQLLSPAQPSYPWPPWRPNLVVRYEYDFMPKGILTRLIVDMHHRISDHDHVWRTGVVFERANTKAEVIEDYPRRKITVRVTGADPRGLIAIIDDQLNRIHQSFRGLKVETHLPCNCVKCAASAEPYAFPMSELKEFAASVDPIQCRSSRKMVDAAALLRDLFPAAMRPPEPVTPLEREVYLSYSWTGESKELANRLQTSLASRAITFRRDTDEIHYKESIRDFMKRLGAGRCVIVILSKRYLESPNCMFELTEIARRQDFRDRIFPIVLDDAGIYEPIGRLQYVKHWEKQKAALEGEMMDVGAENLSGIQESLNDYARYRATIDGLMTILGDMNALSPAQHSGSAFADLIERIETRLG